MSGQDTPDESTGTDQAADSVIPFLEPIKAHVERVCSFCQKKERDVKHMFSNGGVGPKLKCICDRCVGHAHRRILESEQEAPQ